MIVAAGIAVGKAVVSGVSKLVNQTAAERARKQAADQMEAQTRHDPVDQDFLAVASARDITRYEYDNLRRPLDLGNDLQAQLSSGLYPVTGGTNAAKAKAGFIGPSEPGISSVAGLPGGAVPLLIAAAVVLVVVLNH